MDLSVKTSRCCLVSSNRYLWWFLDGNYIGNDLTLGIWWTLCHCLIAGSFWFYTETTAKKIYNNLFIYLFFLFSSAVTDVTHFFSRHEFHYLNVPKAGTVTVDDIFDCTFKCLRIPTCVSVNLAASKETDGKLWCEILSSSKYLNPTEFKENGTSHHFSKVRL